MANLIDPSTGTKLTPSYHGKECLGNGSWVGYECCCDECDYYLECFPEAEPKILRNRARCRKCGSILESRARHDRQTCSCGAISIDGGLEYLRRCAQDLNDIEDLSEVVKPIWDETEQRWI